MTLGSGRETDLFHERPVIPKQYSSSMSPFFQWPTVPISNLNFGTVSNGGVATDFSLGLGYGLIQGWPRRMLVSVEFADAGRKTGTHRVLVVGGCSNTTAPGDIGMSLKEAKTLFSALQWEFVAAQAEITENARWCQLCGSRLNIKDCFGIGYPSNRNGCLRSCSMERSASFG